MKYLSTLLLTVILMLSSATYAQSKVAHLDFQKLISEMPSVIAAQEEVQKLARQQELAGMEQNIQQFRQTASQDIQKKQADLLRPIIENARAKVQEVAKAQGFDYVVDASLGGALLMAEGKDLAPDVKKALGI